jgi:hypothetical protein
MRRVYFLILLALAFSLGLRAQMTNNIPNYLYSGALGVGRNVANDANTYLQVGPNGSATKGVLLPRVADTASISGTKRNGLLIYSNQLAAYAYYDSASVAWRKIGYTDTTVISTRAYAQNILDDSSSVLRALLVAIPSSNAWGSITGTLSAQTDLQSALDAKQATLVSATNIKTINGSTLLGSGDLVVGGGAISALTAAAATNTIDNADYKQTWNWNSLTDIGININSTSTAATTSNYLMNLSRSGAHVASSVTSYGLYSNTTTTGTSSTNYGLMGVASGGTTNYGVRGNGSSAGVYGFSSSSSGIGVTGLSSGQSGKGVEGSATATTGTNYGVFGSAAGSGATTNYGGYFTASGATTNTAVYGSGAQGGGAFYSSGAGSSSLYASNTAATGTNKGAEGTANGAATLNYGLYGSATSATTNYGVYGTAASAGVYGTGFSGSGAGVRSFINFGSSQISMDAQVGSSATGTTYALKGSNGGTGTTNYGIQATASGTGTTNYGAFFSASGATNNYGLIVNTGNSGFGTAAPVASALVEMSSTTQGVLLPRMTKTQRDAISSPATGLMIYQTDNTPGLRVWNGTNWMRYTETAD